MDGVLTDELKVMIDNMSQEELCRQWRFAKLGNIYFQGDTGEYFKERMMMKGGFTPEISKRLGW